MKKYFVVADTHNYYSLMMEALKKSGFEHDNPEHIVVICGDAFDRGPEASIMLSWIEYMLHHSRMVYVWGNHDELLLSLLQRMLTSGAIPHPNDITNGTVNTISQITDIPEVDIKLNMPTSHAALGNLYDRIRALYLNSTGYLTLGKTMFVHGYFADGHYPEVGTYLATSWAGASWINGIAAFMKNPRLPKDINTLVCGHWHCSWGWAQLGIKDCYDPFTITLNGNRLYAIDAMTVRSQKVNCLVFDEDGNLLTD